MAGRYPQLRTMVRGCYDIQQLRIQMGNRIVGNFKAKIGQLPSHAESELDEASKKLLLALRVQGGKLADAVVQEIKTRDARKGIEEEEPDESEEDAPAAQKSEKTEAKQAKIIMELLAGRYKALTDNKKSFPQKASFKGDPVISDYTELCLVSEYMELRRIEEAHFNRLENVLGDYELWNHWLSKVRGVGRAMGGVILSEFDICDRPKKDDLGRVVMENGQPKMKMLRPSSLIKYAGLDTGPDGMGRSRRPEHLVDKEYTTKEGKIEIRKSITFNPFLKTKLIGVLGPSFLRAGDNDNPYAKFYRDYKHRLENHAKWGVHSDGKADPETGKKITSKGRRHAMATRYCVKMFLLALYDAWRKIEGLPVSKTYAEEKLGYMHDGPQGMQGAAAGE